MKPCSVEIKNPSECTLFKSSVAASLFSRPDNKEVKGIFLLKNYESVLLIPANQDSVFLDKLLNTIRPFVL